MNRIPLKSAEEIKIRRVHSKQEETKKGPSKITGSGRDKISPELSLGPLYSQTRVQKFSHSAECYCWNTDFDQEIVGIPRFADRRQACFLAE